MFPVLFVVFQNGSAGWTDEADSNRGRGEASRDFAKVSLLKSRFTEFCIKTSLFSATTKLAFNFLICFCVLLQLYELDNDPKRKEFLDDLFTFMQKRGKNKTLSSSNRRNQIFCGKTIEESGGLFGLVDKD